MIGRALTFIAALAFLPLNTSAEETHQLPTTEQFMNAIAACGGLILDREGNFQSDVRSLYETGRTQGKSITDIETRIIGMLPEDKRFDAYKIYVGCINARLSGQAKLDPPGWGLTSGRADALRLRLQTVFPKPPIYIKCRTIANDCETFAYTLYDVLQKSGWQVAPPMTTQANNLSITGERGIVIISTSFSAEQLKNAMQARDVGGLPAVLQAGGDDQQILINIGDHS